MRIFLFISLAFLPVLSFSQELLNLSGEWHFRLDPDNQGIREEWFLDSAFDDIIRLPGCLQEQGYGNIPDIHTVWWGGRTLEKHFDSSPWLKDYRSAGNFKIQQWLLPERHYIGPAWYAHTVTIPGEWQGKHITLFLERCHWETRLWADGHYIGKRRSLAAPHVYDLSRLTPGKHTLVLRVDNSQIVDLGKMPHSVSEETAGTWNGIVGRLEIRAEDPVHIGRFRIYPDVSTKTIRVEGEIVNILPQKKGSWSMKIEVAGHNRENNPLLPAMHAEGYLKDTLTPFAFEYTLGDSAKLWDEFAPNLYQITLALRSTVDGKSYADRKMKTFGMRHLSRSGRQFSLNGDLIFLRGSVDCADNPRTGYAPMDVEAWRKIWQTYKEFGLNMVRFHSWCPPEAAFIAADEKGIYLAPETGEWTYVSKEAQFDFLREESLEILHTFGDHPSFLFLGLGNESSGNKAFFHRLIETWKKDDPRHLYTIKANSAGNPDNIDYEVVRKTGKPPLKMRYQGGWPPTPLATEFQRRPPQTVIDWNRAVASRNIPLIQHETAQICAYPNLFEEYSKYTGYLRPTYLEIAIDQMRERGMLSQLRDFVMASGKWQMELTREEFEAACRTKELAGFNWLSLVDFTGQNTAPVGFTDVFYDPKPYVDPAKVRQWNGPTVLLARMEKRICTSRDSFHAELEVSHYGKERLFLPATALLKKATGKIIKKWTFPGKEYPQGSAQHIGAISLPLDTFTAPAKLTLVLESKINHLHNEWDLWVYPEIRTEAFPRSVIVTKVWNAGIEKQLKRGRTVLLLPPEGSLKGQLPICFTNYYWTSFGANKGQSSAAGVLIRDDHPLFRDFPTEDHTNWQWWDLLTRCQPMILDSYDTRHPWPHKLQPLIQPIDSWKINRKLALVLEARAGKGKILICSIDIENDLDQRPATRQFRKSLIEYITSKNFHPEVQVSPEMIRGVFRDNE